MARHTQVFLLVQKSIEKVPMSFEPDLSHGTPLLIGPSTSWDLSGATTCPNPACVFFFCDFDSMRSFET